MREKVGPGFLEKLVPHIGKKNLGEGLLDFSGLHPVEAFLDTPWGPCACHEVATDNFSAAEMGLTWASGVGS